MFRLTYTDNGKEYSVIIHDIMDVLAYSEHTIMVTSVTADDLTIYELMNLWESELESANYHNVIRSVGIIFDVLCTFVEDKETRLKMMQQLYGRNALG